MTLNYIILKCIKFVTCRSGPSLVIHDTKPFNPINNRFMYYTKKNWFEMIWKTQIGYRWRWQRKWLMEFRKTCWNEWTINLKGVLSLMDAHRVVYKKLKEFWLFYYDSAKFRIGQSFFDGKIHIVNFCCILNITFPKLKQVSLYFFYQQFPYNTVSTLCVLCRLCYNVLVSPYAHSWKFSTQQYKWSKISWDSNPSHNVKTFAIITGPRSQ